MGDLPRISVQPGQLYLVRSPAILQTILGSCVGVIFWNARLGAGALSHGVLPRCPRGASVADSHRYVDSSIRYLAERFDAMGAGRRETVVKLFGGADVLPIAADRVDKLTIGALNCRRALEVLEEEGFQAAASDLGGTRGRTVHFHTGTGVVLVHRLATLNASENSDNDGVPLVRNRRVPA